jgi:hypothetical protein
MHADAHKIDANSLLDRHPRPLDAVIRERWLQGRIGDLEAEALLVKLCRMTPWLAGNTLAAWHDQKAGYVPKAALHYREADNDQREADGIARKCFTCAGWSNGQMRCSICRIDAISYYVCDHWQRHPRLGPSPKIEALSP